MSDASESVALVAKTSKRYYSSRDVHDGMRVAFVDEAFDYQTLRALAYTTDGGGEPGEVR